MPPPNLAAFCFPDVAAEIAAAADDVARERPTRGPCGMSWAEGYLAGLRMATSMLVPLEEGEL